MVKESTMTYTLAHALDTFPEAVPAARRATKSKLKELKQAVSGLHDFREIWTADIQKLNFKLQPAYIEYLDDLIDRLREGYEREIKKYQWQLNYIENLGKPVDEKKAGSGVTEEQVYRAKQVPITELLQFKRGTTLCIFHDDKRPSLKYYPKDNHVFCFSCQRSADSIDLYMTLNGCDFKEAVRRLAP